MSNSKMREALSALLHEDGGTLAFSAENPKAVAAREALAQPDDVVGLTGEEMKAAYEDGVEQAERKGTQSLRHFYGLRAVIAAHEAKKAGGGK